MSVDTGGGAAALSAAALSAAACADRPLRRAERRTSAPGRFVKQRFMWEQDKDEREREVVFCFP